MVHFSPEERTEIWEHLANGQSMRSIARGLGRDKPIGSGRRLSFQFFFATKPLETLISAL